MIRGGGGDDKHKLGWHVQTPVSHHSSQIQPNMLIRIEMVGSLHFTSTIQQHKYEQMSLTLSLLKGSTTCLAIIESLSSARHKYLHQDFLSLTFFCFGKIKTFNQNQHHFGLGETVEQ